MEALPKIMRQLAFLLVLTACGDGPSRPDIDASPIGEDGEFRCLTAESQACIINTYWSCEPAGEFLERDSEDCDDTDKICVQDLGCKICRPDEIGCVDNNVVQCDNTGDDYELVEECAVDEGFVCRDGSCQNLCDVALQDKSYVGCDFYGVDLDNAALGAGRDASSQQYAIVVSNPGGLPTEVWVEINDAAYGDEPVIRELERVTLGPGDLEVFELPRREVDGSSSNQLCVPSDGDCPTGEGCICALAGRPPCFCRNAPDASGLNDGTHTHVSSQAYRVRSNLPIIAYQFNPLDNVGVFSNDASLLLPTSAISTDYTVVGWPQTIADADCDPREPACRDIDFNPGEDDEDLRGFLTIVGTQSGTLVDLTMGDQVVRVLPYEPASIPLMGSGDEMSIMLGPHDVLNLETDGLNGDFTGTRIAASAPVAVFVGSEASDAPRFDTYATRRCCADHLEDQLFGTEALGSRFMIARMPRRTESLNNAFTDIADSVAEVNESEWIKVVAVAPGETVLSTTLQMPNDRVTLGEGDSVLFEATQDFLLTAMDGKPVAVLQTLSSQQEVGIPSQYPGGDPAIVAVPPVEQYRQDYVFLTPDQYAFDYVIITAESRDTQILLDGEPLDPQRCQESDADGIPRLPADNRPPEVIYRCQLSYPEIGPPCDPDEDPDCDPNGEDVGGGGRRGDNVRDGIQDDGVHTILATDPVGLVVYGFDAYVSYAYAGGLNLRPIPR